MRYIIQKNENILFCETNKEKLLNTLAFYPEFSEKDIQEIQEDNLRKGYDGNWYLSDSLPIEPVSEKAEKKRKERDLCLKESDKFMLVDYPISDEMKDLYRQYRQYLRDIPKEQDFPDGIILNFAEWVKGLNHGNQSGK